MAILLSWLVLCLLRIENNRLCGDISNNFISPPPLRGGVWFLLEINVGSIIFAIEDFFEKGKDITQTGLYYRDVFEARVDPQINRPTVVFFERIGKVFCTF